MRGAAMTHADAHKDALRGPIVYRVNTSVQTSTSLESGGVTIIVTVRVPHELGARVDRDHDHLLREFMTASDE
jgi:hypothetical protein